MGSIHPDFAHYCCELLGSVGPCTPKRMFGGWGISTDGLTIAILADLGGGDTLWLKGNERTRATFEAAGCERFTYAAKGVPRSVNYFSTPADAMESPALMTPWARLALQAALEAKNASTQKAAKKPAAKKSPATKKPAASKPATPRRSRSR